MPHDASGDVRPSPIDELHPNSATFMIARAFAEVYSDVLKERTPEPLAAVLRRMDSRRG